MKLTNHWHVTVSGKHRAQYEVRDTAGKVIAKASRQNAEVIAEMAAALRELVARCDGAEGVLADGSNIQTMRAHALLARIDDSGPEINQPETKQ